MIDDFTGTVLEPGDSGYDDSANTHYAQGSPKLVARPSSAADVAAAIRYAAAQGLELSIRAGGHGTSGMSTNDGGLVIDLTPLDTVEVVDTATNRVRIGGGAVWGHVADELGRHGLALTSGDTASVGVGGLTLGGGIGWVVRAWGLALDSLVEAEVVLADGSIVTANASDRPDLFWALRGGGGNFGVVTAFTFRAHSLPGVVHGTIKLDPEDVAAVLRGWRDAMRTAPRELNTTFLSLPAFGPELPASMQIEVCWAGVDVTDAEAAIAPLLGLPGVQDHSLSASSYRDLLVENPGPPPGITIVDLNAFTAELTDAQIDAIAALHASAGGVLSLRSLGGAFSEVPSDATAFAWRQSEALVIAAAFLPPGTPADTEPRIRGEFAAIDGFRGAYGNFTASRDAAERIYPAETLERLRAIKREVDPAGLLRGNQPISA